MLHSIKQTAIRITAVAVLTAGTAFPLAGNAFAAPTGVGYAASSDQDGCLSSPASINHTFCKDAGGGE